MASVANRVVKNTGWLYAKIGVVMLLSFYTTRVVLDALGTRDFGVFNVVGGAIGMLGFLSGAMATSTQRYMSYAEGEKNVEGKVTIFNISIFIHLIVGICSSLLLIVMGYFLLSYFLNIPAERMIATYCVYGSLIVSTFATILSVPYDAVLNSHENMKYFAIISIFDALLKLFAAYFCKYVGSDHLVSYGFLMAVVPIINLMVMRTYCHSKYNECTISLRKYFDFAKAKEMLKFALWNLLGTIGGLVGNYGQTLISNRFFGVAINAAEGICGQIYSAILVFANNMMKSLNPVIVKSEGEKNREKMIAWSLRGCKYSYVLFSWLTIPVFFEIDYILKLWLTEVPEWTVFFVRITFVRAQIEMLFVGLSTSLNACGNIKLYNKVYTTLFLSALFFVYVANMLGAGPDFRYWFMLLLIIIQWLTTIYICKKIVGLKIDLYISKVLSPILILSLLLVSSSYLSTILLPVSFLRLVVTFGITWLVLALSLFTFFPDDIEKVYIYSLLKKVISRTQIGGK